MAGSVGDDVIYLAEEFGARACGHIAIYHSPAYVFIIAMPLQPSFRLAPTTVMEPASIDSGLRRNDGVGEAE